MKLWKKDTPLDQRIEIFTVGDDPQIDQRLVVYDCLASIAHAKSLENAGILSQKEAEKLVKELREIINLDHQGKFKIEQDQEDCHTAIENHLTKKLGTLGKKIHTGRSRNDQVIAALRLYYKNEICEMLKEIDAFIATLKQFKKEYGKIQWPGFTHTRKAMVNSMNMWSDGFIESMEDNIKLLKLVQELIDQSPLGTGAGFGVPLDMDRKMTAQLAGFHKVQKSPVYVQNSRGKFESSIVHACSQVMLDLNRLSTDLILYSMPSFGYFELPAEFCTGSSIMPQKKNPDVLELVRAKYHILISHEIALKSMISNLISGYHRDLQLTKKPVMESLEITRQSVVIITHVFRHLEVNAENCKKDLTQELYATDRAYELVRQGMPFRDAYQKISKEFN